MTKAYKGSCHCARVRFEADLDLTQGTGRCNCTLCTKARWWGAMAKPDGFRLVEGEDALTTYTSPSGGDNLFCSTCGIKTHGHGDVAEIGGEYYSVNIGCLDDVDPEELKQAPITFFDGRANTWAPLPENLHL